MRIRQSSLYLNQLVADVRAGRLAPAAFQRPYVWGRDDVLALVASVLKGYPMGGFLLWTPARSCNLAALGRRRLGPIEASAATGDVSLLLDGQNRLATMAWLMRDPAEPLPTDLTEHEQAVWGTEVLACDLDHQTVRYMPPAELDASLAIPFHALLDSERANRFCRERWATTWSAWAEDDKNNGLRHLDHCQNAFRNAQVVATNLEQATAEEAKDAFLHICKVGVPMSAADFEAAVSWSA